MVRSSDRCPAPKRVESGCPYNRTKTLGIGHRRLGKDERPIEIAGWNTASERVSWKILLLSSFQLRLLPLILHTRRRIPPFRAGI